MKKIEKINIYKIAYSLLLTPLRYVTNCKAFFFNCKNYKMIRVNPAVKKVVEPIPCLN